MQHYFVLGGRGQYGYYQSGYPSMNSGPIDHVYSNLHLSTEAT